MPGPHVVAGKGIDVVHLLEQDGAAKRVEFHRRQVIFRQGSNAGTIFYLERGTVKIGVVGEQGDEAVIGILPAGSFLGEECLQGTSRYVVSAEALVPCSLLALKPEQLLAALRKYPEFAKFFMVFLVERNLRGMENLADQLLSTSAERLARILIRLADFGVDQDTGAIVPQLSQEILASMVGTTRSRINYFMNQFRRSGFIEYDQSSEGHSTWLRVHPALLKPTLRELQS